MVMPKNTQSDGQSEGRTAAIAIHRGNWGNERTNSIRRWMAVSTHPPK